MPPSARSGLASIRYMGRALGGLGTVLNLLSVLTAAIAVGHPGSVAARVAVVTMAALIIGHVALEERQSRRSGEAPGLLMGKVPLPRATTAIAALAVAVDHDRTWTTVALVIVLLGLIVVEGAVRRPVINATPQAANVPGWNVVLPSTPVANAYFVLTTTAVLLLAACAAFHVTQIPAAIATAATLLAAALVGKQSAIYLMGRNRFERNLPKIMREIAPAFAFHWQAPAGTAYQATMWLPYLDRIGVPYFVLVRTIANFHEVSKMTSAPVILRVGLEDLDPVNCPSMKAVFYANTAVRNSHMIRFTHLTHIQLNHGDSDKIASVSPTFRQYDRNFVAGQAAIDRFAKHGVATLPEQFEIVGRPQLEHVQQATRTIAEIEKPTVLYSPTWSGFYEDSDYSSLSAGKAIVEALIARGCTVVFRPHPYGRRHKGNARACDEIIAMLEQHGRETGTPHVFGPAAETEMSVVDCFNASDAMISDVSSVASDFLISGKPFAMTAVSAHGDAFLEGFPLARAAYVIDVVKRVAGGLDEALDDMLGADSHAETRHGLRTYYLSETPPERITERFLEVSRSYLT